MTITTATDEVVENKQTAAKKDNYDLRYFISACFTFVNALYIHHHISILSVAMLLFPIPTEQLICGMSLTSQVKFGALHKIIFLKTPSKNFTV